jgi:hypothetical protein
MSSLRFVSAKLTTRHDGDVTESLEDTLDGIARAVDGFALQTVVLCALAVRLRAPGHCVSESVH